MLSSDFPLQETGGPASRRGRSSGDGAIVPRGGQTIICGNLNVAKIYYRGDWITANRGNGAQEHKATVIHAAGNGTESGTIVRVDPATPPARVLICSMGSPGDLFPYLAIAQKLQERGHHPTIATHMAHRDRVTALGLPFLPIRPDRSEWVADPDLVVRVRQNWRQPAVAFREMFMPALRESYADTLAAAADADLVVSHALAFTAGLAASRRGIPWVSCVLQPMGFFSRHDLPRLGPRGLMTALERCGPRVVNPAFDAAEWLMNRWCAPWRDLWREEGFEPVVGNPVTGGQHSETLALGLFSPVLGDPKPDWPVQSLVTGFPWLDDPAAPRIPDRVEEFLRAGPPPIVFTLGMTAVLDAGDFYQHSARAAASLGMRALFLTGNDPRNVPTNLPGGAFATPNAPHGPLFERSAAVVHSGGIGTLARAMRAGIPMVIMPYAHDQPDNAARAVRLGIARRIERYNYRAGTAAAALRSVLEDESIVRTAREIGARVRAEDGAARAADAIESVLSGAAQSRFGKRLERFPALTAW